MLHALRALGVGLALDDFGAGMWDPLALVELPVEMVKLDRSLVTGLDSSPSAVAIARHIVDMAHARGMTVVAEGVEQPSQLETVRALGCDYAQGYLMGRPCAIAEIGRRPQRLSG